ncbi:stress-induced protein [Gordoniibacillus kamchatkensis]|uniref:Stress-induced protein n=1 Tax=Gordoniibacillus kamchatkensis TaxID=1590651 RepID=A0ABR5AJB8_9BACL|nr:YicC/YloC family endoribonuclease [Paenibacillus sp. VKM B-2647]KIL41141.1 stress-induced protein [Paenibacillus sp. VKM B-2647]
MIRSMTGYGQAQGELPGTIVLIDVKSVNHRFLETVVRLPRELQSLEEPLRKTVQQAARRGRFDVFVTVERSAEGESGVDIDWPLVHAYAGAARELRGKLGLQDELTLQHLLQLPDVVRLRNSAAGDEETRQVLVDVLGSALAALTRMREDEGIHLCADLSSRLDALEAERQKVAKLAPEAVHSYAAKLKERIRELLRGETGIDEQRMAGEIALMADRSNVDEELTRLDSHIRQFRKLLQSAEAVGRKLDFLIQEMNREVNTIGSKSAHTDITACVIEMKAELEKMREQVQNIE